MTNLQKLEKCLDQWAENGEINEADREFIKELLEDDCL